MPFRNTHASHGSDHFPILLVVPLKFDNTCNSSNRLRLDKVSWGTFEEVIKNQIPQIARSDEEPRAKYGKVMSVIVEALTTAGAYIPSKISSRSPVKPSWWNKECDHITKKRKKLEGNICATLVKSI